MKFFILISFFTIAIFAGDLAKSYVRDFSCGEYLEFEGEKKEIAKVWIAGYLTGANVTKGRITNIDIPSAYFWIQNFCKANPLNHFLEGLIALDKELDKK